MKENDEILEINKVKEIMLEYCFTDAAKQKVHDMRPYLDELALKAALRETSEAKIMIEKSGNPPLTSIEGMSEILIVAEKGGCLTAEQLEMVSVTLTAVRRLKDYLNRCKSYELSLAYFEENMDSMDTVREEINQKIRGGRVDDYASKTLHDLRTSISKTETKMREKAESVMRSNKECMSDSFSTFRNGHICIPVKKEYKFKIAGSVIDKSSTGNTLFIEPIGVNKIFEELQVLKLAEENEEIRILYVLTALLSDSVLTMQNNSITIEKLDFAFAKAKMSLYYDGTEPNLISERKISITSGRHPLMKKEVNVPLNFKIGDGINGVVITGPNTGGKTVAIKTVALNAYLGQCGMHVACEDAKICMNDLYLCDIGDGQNLSENLSTFSAHITNALDILSKADKDSLVIMDELGSGTDPTEGMGIAIAILEELKKSGALYLVTTHYPEIKQYAARTEGVINARMTFDKETLRPLYQMIIGEAGESCALYIAQQLGMPESMLERAHMAAYGKNLPNELRVSSTDHKLVHTKNAGVRKIRNHSFKPKEAEQYKLGDSVMVLPDKKIAIVCQTADEKGVLRVQLQKKKIYINYKRVKLLVPAEQLYPADYDFSIVFDSVAKRKAEHQMERKHIEGYTFEFEED